MCLFRQFRARETSVLSTTSLRDVYLLIKLENLKIRLENELVRNISFGNCIGSMAWSFEQIHFFNSMSSADLVTLCSWFFPPEGQI